MKPEELIKYELPNFAELCSIGWIQTLIARYYARKVNKKFRRYQMRLKREEYFRSKTPLQDNNNINSPRV